MLCFELSDIRLVEVHLRLKRRLLELVEEIVLLDLGALDKEPLFEKRGDPRNERHPADAWMRPMNSSVWVICCRSARTTPTAGGPPGAV